MQADCKLETTESNTKERLHLISEENNQTSQMIKGVFPFWVIFSIRSTRPILTVYSPASI